MVIETNGTGWSGIVASVVSGGFGWWVAASAIDTMPPPRPDERWYGWAYRFLQRMAANHSRVGNVDTNVIITSTTTGTKTDSEQLGSK